MKLNRAERWVVNNPVRVMIQRFIIGRMQRMLSLPPEGVILEVGCGRGAGASLLLREFRPRRLHAMDLDLKMLRKATAYLPPEEKGQITLYLGDALNLPYRDAALDAVFAFGVLHHIPDWRGALQEIVRVLKPGGAYFLEEFYPPFYLNFLARRLFLHPERDRFYSEDLRQALAAARLPLTRAWELKKLGIWGVAVKE
jgi:ubiquinone/menaquinone biosynthesis C-methylase UbiE